MREILAVIPARGGSVRLPGKNLRLLNGKSLLVYAIEQALASSLITRVVVSSESDEILNIARQYGVGALQRPATLAEDETPTLPVLQRVVADLFKYEEYKPQLVVLLQCTSPLRTVEDIDGTIQLVLDGAQSAVSVCNDKVNGSVYVSYAYTIMETDRLLTEKPTLWEMPPERSIDIDTEADLAEAEKIMEGRNDNLRTLPELSEPRASTRNDKKQSRKRRKSR